MLIGNIHFKGREFPASAVVGAQNGVSIETVLGQNFVELGNNSGDTDGQLLHDTEIPLNSANLNITAGVNQRLVQFNQDGMLLQGESAFPFFQGIGIYWDEVSSGGRSYFQRQVEGLDIGMSNPAASIMRFLDNGRVVYQGLTFPGLVSDGTADFTINGALSARKILRVETANVQLSGNGNVTVTNEGAAGAVSVECLAFTPGATVTLVVREAQTLSIFGAAQTFRIFNNVTAAGGSVSSNQVGSAITFELCDNGLTDWVCTSMIGAWTL